MSPPPTPSSPMIPSPAASAERPEGPAAPAAPTAGRAFKSAAYGLLAEVGRALSSPARLELLELLAQAPRSVEALAAELGQSVANTSHHLQALKRARLVSATRRGAHVQYRLSGPEVAALLRQLQAVAATHLAELDRLSRDFFDDPAGFAPLDAAGLRARLQAGEVLLLDVRPAEEHAAGHLPGAWSAPLDRFATWVAALPADRAIIAYCRGPYCAFSAEAVRRLRALGFDARRADIAPHAFLGEQVDA